MWWITVLGQIRRNKTVDSIQIRERAMGSKRKRKARRITLVGDARVSPTPETRRKLKPDPLWQLAEELGAERIQASHEIRDAVVMISAPLRIRVQRWEREERGHGEYETERAVRIQQRYNAWVDVMTEAKTPVGPALDMIVEGESSREIETARKWRHGSYKPYFLDALDRYCKISARRR